MLNKLACPISGSLNIKYETVSLYTLREMLTDNVVLLLNNSQTGAMPIDKPSFIDWLDQQEYSDDYILIGSFSEKESVRGFNTWIYIM